MLFNNESNERNKEYIIEIYINCIIFTLTKDKNNSNDKNSRLNQAKMNNYSY